MATSRRTRNSDFGSIEPTTRFGHDLADDGGRRPGERCRAQAITLLYDVHTAHYRTVQYSTVLRCPVLCCTVLVRMRRYD